MGGGNAAILAIRLATPEQFAAMIKAETARWAKVIKSANIKLEE